MQGIRVRQDRQSARELSHERRIMPLRYFAVRGWRGPRAVIVIGGACQLSAGILAEKRRAHKTMIRRNSGEKGVRRGSGEPYRHSDFWIAPCAHMRCRCSHCVSEPAIARHPAALWPIVVIVPTMETTVVGSRTLSRGAILCCIRVLVQEKSIARARSGQHGPQLLDFSHILRLTN